MAEHSWTWDWLPDQGTGSERFACRTSPAGNVLRGEISATLDGKPVEARYMVETDTAWATRRVLVEIANQNRALEIQSNGAGRWSDAQGVWIPALDGCIDVDISLTPATNTLPIRRLGSRPGEVTEITVAYVLAPELRLHAGRQRYTLLGEGSWRFEAPQTGFTADISVDAEGFVLDYPGLFQRRL